MSKGTRLEEVRELNKRLNAEFYGDSMSFACEVALRENNPSVKDAYEKYLITLKLCKNNKAQ